MTWYDTNYGYKKKITIDHTKVSGDETDFPVLISVTDNDLRDEANGGHVKNANGYDIIFTNSAENMQLKHEIERYVNTSGLLVYWVKISSLSSTADTDIYIYYSKVGVGADPSSTDTWDSNFLGVYHLDDTGASCDDSTSNVNDGTYQGNMPNRVAGKTGYGQDFVSANGDYITLPSGCMIGLAGTMESLVKLDTTNVRNKLCSFQQGINNFTQVQMYGDVVPNKIDFTGKIAGINQWDIYQNATLTTNWDYYANAYQTDDAISILNTTTVGTDTNLTPAAWTYTSIYIGADVVGGKSNFILDEFRISNIRRSTNWLNTTSRTQRDPAGFISFESEIKQPIMRSISDSVNISDSMTFKRKANFTDSINISDTVSFEMTDACVSIFQLHSNLYTLYMPMPEYGGEKGTLNNDIKLFDFWMGERDTDNIGINSEPVILNGTIQACTNDEDAEMTSIAVKFLCIHEMMDNHNEVTITGLGDCYDAVYIIKNFRYGTIRGSPYAYTWQLTLEYVRAI